MQQHSFEFVEVSDNRYELPITLKQSNAKLARLPGLALMLALAGGIVVPQIGFVAYALASPETRAAFADQPMVSLELAVALIFWTGLVCWPLRRILGALISDRYVDIRDGGVTVVDQTPFSRTAWRMPLATFEGVALHLRSSLSGVRAEAVLVHPSRNRSVVLMVAEHIGEREILGLCRVLKLPRILAARLYDFGRPPRGGPSAKSHSHAQTA